MTLTDELKILNDKIKAKKDDQVNNANKYENDLVYNSVHNFNKYSVFHLSKT